MYCKSDKKEIKDFQAIEDFIPYGINLYRVMCRRISGEVRVEYVTSPSAREAELYFTVDDRVNAAVAELIYSHGE